LPTNLIFFIYFFALFFFTLNHISDLLIEFVCYRMAVLSFPPFLLLTFALLTLLHGTESYPSGAPDSACLTLAPKHHGAAAQQTLSPFAVTLGKPSVAPGSKLKLMMTSTTGTPFKGFILQARQSEDSDSAIGQFTALPNLTKALTCAGGYLVSSFLLLDDSLPLMNTNV
jgi:hypothetical protein